MNLQISPIKVIPKYITTAEGRTVLAYFVIAEIAGEIRVKVLFSDPRTNSASNNQPLCLAGACTSPFTLDGSSPSLTRTISFGPLDGAISPFQELFFTTCQKTRGPNL